ncbi:hypothetical protein PybrP1_012097 [[Pythium] brassicae (nom. inval.)]|nr:hypothetical protein PybrP1_012097 [[Pythium] brassicae (nom. inval.)]
MCLNATAHFGLTYSKCRHHASSRTVDIIILSDADWAGHRADRKSTDGSRIRVGVYEASRARTTCSFGHADTRDRQQVGENGHHVRDDHTTIGARSTPLLL